MNGFRSDLLRQDAAQMRAMTERWRQVEANLQAEVLRFTERVRQDGLTVGQLQSRQFQLDRYVSLLSQVRRELDKYTDYAEPVIVAGQRQAAATGINAATAAINAVASEAGTRIAFDVLPVNAVQNLVGLAGNGSPLRTLLVGSYGAGADGMFNELINATAKGQNPRVTARNMVRQGLSQSLDRMLLTARTEQLRVFRESSRQQYINSGVVTQYRRLATKSPRTCLGCLLSDGELYELEDSLREHPGGRCTLIPVVKGFPPVKWETGQDWLLNQSTATQRSIMGPGRFKAWQEGRIDLPAMVTVRRNSIWGDSVQPTPLRDLVGGDPGVVY